MKIGVWGTGNVGAGCVAAALGHPQLELVVVQSSTASKAGMTVGELCQGNYGQWDDHPLTITHGTDVSAFVEAGCDVIAYAAAGDIRPMEALEDIASALAAGISVSSPSVYPLYDPTTAPPELVAPLEQACQQGDSALVMTGVDPGWGNDVLALMGSGLCHSIRQIRCQEIFDYSDYNQEYSVRELVGLGQPMENTPLMVAPGVPTMVWGGQIHMIARTLGIEIASVEETLEKVALENTVHTALGEFTEGTIGGLRFEIIGVTEQGDHALVIEHITRIHPDVAPQWPQPISGQGTHKVIVSGVPELELSVQARTTDGSHAGGGNATASMRLVSALPWLHNAPAGLYDGTQVPLEPGTDRFIFSTS